ncbi:hypothetical protein HPB48_000503 [Haemaphysalis longicornis]|uniref:Nuclease HARBI1 n=1 Tax=Haemaphysalis longicornis TaxID=44386 RepID=A0A9J6FQA3_HAELO|nr:hypothetical protein HPB48_000503 [Haemaphysalis longicornis]
MSEPTQSRIVREILQVLCERRRQFVHFLTSRQDQRETARVFFERFGFPGVVGPIDGTHIPIKNPGGDTQALYICRKNFHSLNVQVTEPTELGLSAIHQRQFLISAGLRRRREDHVVARWRGSAHDNRIWEESNLRKKFAANVSNKFCRFSQCVS